jgi:hypothetical protein
LTVAHIIVYRVPAVGQDERFLHGVEDRDK